MLAIQCSLYTDMGDSSESEPETPMFQHQHFFYVFSNRPRKLVDNVDDPNCSGMVRLKKRVFKRVFNGTVCTYVCQHDDTIAASKATFEFKPKVVINELELFEGYTIRKEYFEEGDFDCVTSSGWLVPLEAVVHATATEVEPNKICEVAKQMAVSVSEEASKNGIVRQIVQKKIGTDFLVTKKPITQRGGDRYSQYYRSQHDVCIQHKMKHFRGGTTRSAVVAGPSVTSVEAVEEGQVVASVMELEIGLFARDQTIAQMMCTLTDGGVEVLRDGKQISKAIVFGLSVNYTSMKAILYKMVMDFSDSTFTVVVLEDNVSLEHGLNLVVNFLDLDA